MKKLDELQKDWNDLAEIDAMWAICSDPDKQLNKWDRDEFFESGRQHISKVLEIANQAGISINRRLALDFGCGMGRLTQALAGEFDECYGIDISPKMIELAEQYNLFGNKCKYILNQRDDLKIFDDNSFDFIYTVEVLQHINPEFMKKYINEFVRLLNAGGVLIFQVPVEHILKDSNPNQLKKLPKFHPKRVFNKLKGILIGHDSTTRYYRLRKLGFSKNWLYNRFGLRPMIEMHFLEETSIVNIVEGMGAVIVFSTKSPNTSGDMLMGTYFVVKSTV
jgi:ubiquinone/menaquinone biosynthesis C-methylase UbiE